MQADAVDTDEDLLTVGAMLARYTPGLFKEAAVRFFRLRYNHDPKELASAISVYTSAISRREDGMIQQTPQAPTECFPWNKPEPMLRQQQKRIEEFLAPLSDRRYKASKLQAKT